MKLLAVTNMYPSPERPSLGIFVQQQLQGLQATGLEIELLVVDRRGKGPQAYLEVGARVLERMTQCRCDLVHVMYGGIMARAVARTVERVPLVVSLCGSDLLGTTGRWPVAALRSWISRRASIAACRSADAVVVKSDGLARALPSTVNRSKVHVLPNGVDLDCFRPMDRIQCLRQLGWAGEAFHIVFALGDDPLTKRLDLAQHAAALARSAGVPVEFHILKGIVHAEMPTYLNASDVLLLTSRHEGSPNIVKESLACNLPVVSVDVGDVAERVHGIEGCHIVPPVAVSIACALQAVAARRTRIEGRSRLRSLSILQVAEQLRRLYETLLDAKGQVLAHAA